MGITLREASFKVADDRQEEEKKDNYYFDRYKEENQGKPLIRNVQVRDLAIYIDAVEFPRQ